MGVWSLPLPSSTSTFHRVTKAQGASANARFQRPHWLAASALVLPHNRDLVRTAVMQPEIESGRRVKVLPPCGAAAPVGGGRRIGLGLLCKGGPKNRKTTTWPTGISNKVVNDEKNP